MSDLLSLLAALWAIFAFIGWFFDKDGHREPADYDDADDCD